MRFGSLSGDGKGAVEYISSVPSQAARLEVSSNNLFFGRKQITQMLQYVQISQLFSSGQRLPRALRSSYIAHNHRLKYKRPFDNTDRIQGLGQQPGRLYR